MSDLFSALRSDILGSAHLLRSKFASRVEQSVCSAEIRQWHSPHLHQHLPFDQSGVVDEWIGVNLRLNGFTADVLTFETF